MMKKVLFAFIVVSSLFFGSCSGVGEELDGFVREHAEKNKGVTEESSKVKFLDSLPNKITYKNFTDYVDNLLGIENPDNCSLKGKVTVINNLEIKYGPAEAEITGNQFHLEIPNSVIRKIFGSDFCYVNCMILDESGLKVLATYSAKLVLSDTSEI